MNGGRNANRQKRRIGAAFWAGILKFGSNTQITMPIVMSGKLFCVVTTLVHSKLTTLSLDGSLA